MARNAIDEVKAAEERAREMIREAEAIAVQTVNEARLAAKERLDVMREEAMRKETDTRQECKEQSTARLSAYEPELSKECQTVRQKMLSQKDGIIAAIKEAVTG